MVGCVLSALVGVVVNPWVLFGLAVAWAASVGGSFFYGQDVGKDSEIAGQAKIKQAIEDTREKAQQGAASAIAEIKIVNTTIHQKAETVVRTERVYTDCRHAPGMRDTINSAITGRPEPVGDGKLPAAQPAK